MEVKNKTEIKVEDNKCSFICDSDCQLGQLLDFVNQVRLMVLQKLNELNKEEVKNCTNLPSCDHCIKE